MTLKHLTRTKAGKALLSLVALALLAVALQSLVFSEASFVAKSGNAANVFAAGSLSHTNSKPIGQLLLDASRLVPGKYKEDSVTIAGGGDLTGTYRVNVAQLVDTPVTPGLSRTLVLQIQDLSLATPAFDAKVSSMTVSVPLGTIAPGASRTYRFRLTYPAAAASTALDGAAMSLRLTFTGVAQ